MQAFSERLLREHAAAGTPAGAALDLPSRAEALRRAAAAGLPGLRDDHWRYTRLRPVEKAPFTAAGLPADAVVEALRATLPAAIPGHARFVFVNGHFAPSLSDAVGGEPGLRLDAGTAVLAAAGFPEPTADERFAWINTAFGTANTTLDVDGDVRIELLFVASPDAGAAAAYPRLVVDARRGTRLSLIERHLGTAGDTGVVNAFVQLRAGPGATVDHYRLQALAPGATFQDTLLGDVGRDADYRLTAARAGRDVRALDGPHRAVRRRRQAHAARDGPRPRAAGARHGDRGRTPRPAHDERAGAARGGERPGAGQLPEPRAGRGGCARRIVAAVSQGSHRRHGRRGEPAAAAGDLHGRGEGEPRRDDGALDEATLFYLLSRGLDRETARRLLEWAFIEDVVSHVALPALRRQVELAALDDLGNEAAREALA